jgi:hypothetical protein
MSTIRVGQGNKQEIIIADVIRSFLVENVDAVIFIHLGGCPTIQNRPKKKGG